jgi:hypothetical protein
MCEVNEFMVSAYWAGDGGTLHIQVRRARPARAGRANQFWSARSAKVPCLKYLFGEAARPGVDCVVLSFPELARPAVVSSADEFRPRQDSQLARA